MAPKGLMERLRSGEKVVVAEGYIFNFERRCYIQSGPFVPMVVLEHPDLVRQLHKEFVRAGSDVVLAFTYYGHREKLRLIGQEHLLEKLNRDALKIAREVADESGTLMAGNICMTYQYNTDIPNYRENVKAIFKEQIEWAVEEGADFIVAETLVILDEALIALQAIKEYGKGLPAVVTLSPSAKDVDGKVYTVDGVELTDAMKRLESAGADVVGLNCFTGPETIIPLMEDIQKSGVEVPLACLPITYRTTEKEQTFLALTDPKTGEKLFPTNLDCVMSSQDDISRFGRKCGEMGILYLGLCCGNSPHYTRALCEAIGRKPPASEYSADMSKHCLLGTDEKVDKYLKETGSRTLVRA